MTYLHPLMQLFSDFILSFPTEEGVDDFSLGYKSVSPPDNCTSSSFSSNCSSCLQEPTCAWCLPYISSGTDVTVASFCSSLSRSGYSECQGRYITVASSSTCEAKSSNNSRVVVILMTIFVMVCCCSCLTASIYFIVKSVTKSRTRVIPGDNDNFEQAEAFWGNDILSNCPHGVDVEMHNPVYRLNGPSMGTQTIIHDPLGIRNHHGSLCIANSCVIQESKVGDISLIRLNDVPLYGSNSDISVALSATMINQSNLINLDGSLSQVEIDHNLGNHALLHLSTRNRSSNRDWYISNWDVPVFHHVTVLATAFKHCKLVSSPLFTLFNTFSWRTLSDGNRGLTARIETYDRKLFTIILSTYLFQPLFFIDFMLSLRAFISDNPIPLWAHSYP